MPVRKFRSVEDMPSVASYAPGTPALFRAVGITWELARRTSPRRFSRGVRRFRSLDEMRRAEDAGEPWLGRDVRDARSDQP